MRQHTSAYVYVSIRIRQHTSASVATCGERVLKGQRLGVITALWYVFDFLVAHNRPHLQASAYVSIRQHTSALLPTIGRTCSSLTQKSQRTYTSSYVSIRIRQHTSASVVTCSSLTQKSCSAIAMLASTLPASSSSATGPPTDAKAVIGRPTNPSPPPPPPPPPLLPALQLRQYLYFCTSKASELSSPATSPPFVARFRVVHFELLRRIHGLD